MQLSIITINFRKPSVTLSCIASVYTVYKKQFEDNVYELLVVDNFSGDNSVEVLQKEIKQKKYKNVRVLPHNENNGFGGGNNFGALHAKGEYLLFLNNDTIVTSGIVEMHAFLEKNSHVGVVGGALKNISGTFQHSYDRFYNLLFVVGLLLGFQRLGSQAVTKPMLVDWVKGACLMIRKDLFDKLKGFDERIFMYTEDMELCYRVRKMGKEVWIFPTDIMHEDQGSSNRSFAIIEIYKGILYFFKKHKSYMEYVIAKLLLQSKAILLLSLGKVTRNSYLISTYEQAFDVTR